MSSSLTSWAIRVRFGACIRRTALCVHGLKNGGQYFVSMAFLSVSRLVPDGHRSGVLQTVAPLSKCSLAFRPRRGRKTSEPRRSGPLCLAPPSHSRRGQAPDGCNRKSLRDKSAATDGAVESEHSAKCKTGT